MVFMACVSGAVKVVASAGCVCVEMDEKDRRKDGISR
jgi:hypothetical protein